MVTYSGEDITHVHVDPTGTKEGSDTYTAPAFTFNNKEYTPQIVDAIAALGTYNVSGTVTSFTSNDTSDEAKVVTLTLSKEGLETPYITTADPETGAYTFTSVEPGTYTLTVSKKDHATRVYEGADAVVVTNSNITGKDVKIHLMGDIDGDGKVTTIDFARAYWHACGIASKQLDAYQQACADVVEGEEPGVTNADALRINQHVRSHNWLW